MRIEITPMDLYFIGADKNPQCIKALRAFKLECLNLCKDHYEEFVKHCAHNVAKGSIPENAAAKSLIEIPMKADWLTEDQYYCCMGITVSVSKELYNKLHTKSN